MIWKARLPPIKKKKPWGDPDTKKTTTYFSFWVFLAACFGITLKFFFFFFHIEEGETKKKKKKIVLF